jgi:cellulose synthase/poly-beta-1,6-N-acetylglucosamine synthase-like glycosyltransferase
MVSVVITSWNEPRSIGAAIRCIADKEYSGVEEDVQVIQVSPDSETLANGLTAAKELGLKNFIQIKDPQKGKPFALNLALKKAKGDRIVLTDGDVYFAKGALKLMLIPFEDKSIGGVTGRPVPQNSREGFLGYLSHMLTDVADVRRKEVFTDDRGRYLVNDDKPFLLSGYIRANRNTGDEYDTRFIDDAYMTSVIHRSGAKLAYVPEALAYVRFPTTLKDYFNQRRRNLAGNRKVHMADGGKEIKDQRSLIHELMYMFYPLTYARNLQELLWSLLFYPLRLATWLYTVPEIIMERLQGKEANWERIESTK